MLFSISVSAASKQQYEDNIHWIKEAGKHKMVSKGYNFWSNLSI